MGLNRKIYSVIGLTICLSAISLKAQVAYDIEMAMDICRELPLESVEGIWLYPDDKVTVMILNEDRDDTGNFSSYSISVVETTDAALNPGEEIGKLYATAKDDVFKIELNTERKNDLLLKPRSCMATLSKDGDTFIIKKQKSPLKARLNLNFNRLLPGFWKIVSTGISSAGKSNEVALPVGMIKIYPSYDGNGSSRRKVRYL